MTDPSKKHCVPCEGGIPKLSPAEAQQYCTNLKDWELNSDSTCLTKHFNFLDYYRTMAFVNAVAWIAHNENHHPDLTVSYNHCTVSFMTHAIQGLSENDFICAAKIDQLPYL